VITLNPLPASTGRVTCINKERRWLFIRDDNRPQEVFLPRNEWRGSEAEWAALKIDDRLRYRVALNHRIPNRFLAVLAVPENAGGRWSDDPVTVDPREALTGRVISWWPERQYGFLREDRSGRELYFQIAEVPEALRDRIRTGARVIFRLEEDLARPGRIQAVSVRPAA